MFRIATRRSTESGAPVTIVAITGGRDYVPTERDAQTFRAWLGLVGATVLRHGDCRGVDRWGAGIASAASVTVEGWAADWSMGPSGGPLRNRAMLRGDTSWDRPTSGQVQHLGAFPGADGTADCIRAATELDVEVHIIGGRTPEEQLPTVVNRHWYKGESLPSEARYIGRGTPLGNLYTVSEHGERALELYRMWLWDKIHRSDAAVCAEMQAITPETLLVCSCKPRPCHGDVVVRAWSWMRENGMITVS